VGTGDIKSLPSIESVRVHGKGEAGNNSGDGAGKPEALGGDFIAET